MPRKDQNDTSNERTGKQSQSEKDASQKGQPRQGQSQQGQPRQGQSQQNQPQREQSEQPREGGGRTGSDQSKQAGSSSRSGSERGPKGTNS